MVRRKSSLNRMEPKSNLIINIADPIPNGWADSDIGKATFDKFWKMCKFEKSDYY